MDYCDCIKKYWCFLYLLFFSLLSLSFGLLHSSYKWWNHKVTPCIIAEIISPANLQIHQTANYSAIHFDSSWLPIELNPEHISNRMSVCLSVCIASGTCCIACGAISVSFPQLTRLFLLIPFHYLARPFLLWRTLSMLLCCHAVLLLC